MNLKQGLRQAGGKVSTGAPIIRGNEVCISKTQRNVHVAAEALAVFVVAPLTGYIAWKNKDLPDWSRVFLGAVAVGTIVIDGGLLISYWRAKKAAENA